MGGQSSVYIPGCLRARRPSSSADFVRLEAAQQDADDVGGVILSAAFRHEAFQVAKVIAARDDAGFDERPARTPLRMAHRSDEGVADALSSLGLGDIATFRLVDVHRLAGAAEIDCAFGRPICLAQVTEVADTGPRLIDRFV